MSDRIKSLRDRVEAAQALAAKATPGPWSVCPQWGEVLAPSGAFVVAEGDPDAHLMAAAPDLVTLATDLLAELEWQDERHGTRAEQEAEEAAWRPGETAAQAVERLRGENARMTARMGEYERRAQAAETTLFELRGMQTLTTGSPAMDDSRCCRAIVRTSTTRYRIGTLTATTTCILPAGHEGPHAEALAGGDGR